MPLSEQGSGLRLDWSSSGRGSLLLAVPLSACTFVLVLAALASAELSGLAFVLFVLVPGPLVITAVIGVLVHVLLSGWRIHHAWVYMLSGSAIAVTVGAVGMGGSWPVGSAALSGLAAGLVFWFFAVRLAQPHPAARSRGG